MALASDQSKSHVLSQLSADSVSFVPAHSRQSVVLDNCDHRPGNMAVPMPAVIPQSANYLPGYVMSCYPYVDADNSAGFQGTGLSAGAGMVDLQGKAVQSHLHPKPTSNNFYLDNHCAPQINSVMTPPTFLPPPAVNPSLRVPFVAPMQMPSQSTPTFVQSPALGSVPTPPPPHGYLGIPSTLYGFNPSLQLVHGMQFPGYFYPAAVQNQSVWCMTNQAKPEEKASKPHSKMKVIVCKDNHAQTDFNDELAQLTLAERPNTLFMRDQSTQGADSDSGYSSPQHRKNQTSTAIQSSPLSAHRPLPTPATSHPVPNVIVQAPPPPNNGFQTFPNPVFPYVLPPAYQIHQFPAVSYPPPMQFTGPRPLLVQGGSETYPSRFVVVDGIRNRPRFRGKKKPGFVPNSPRPPLAEECSDISKWKSVSTSVADGVPRPAAPDANCADPPVYPTGERDVRLPFEDEDEFPILLSAVGGLVAQGDCFRSSPLTYGEILRSPSTQSTSRSRRSSASSSDRRKSNSLPSNVTPPNAGLANNKDSKSVRKKQKRQLLAQQAAEEELAEISLEQQMLRELSTKQQKKQVVGAVEKPPLVTVPSSVPCHPVPEPAQAVTVASSVPNGVAIPALFNIMDEIGHLEEAKTEEGSNELQDASLFSSSVPDLTIAAKRNKDREFLNNKKKPSSLKRVILKEREAKNRHSLLDNCSTSILPDGTVALVNNDTSQSELGSGLVEALAPPTLTSAEMSPVSQMSPINMSPLSGSPAGSAGASPIAGDGTLGSGRSSVLSKIHSRRFREYCNQVLDKEIDDCCTELLQDLVRFQDRLYHDDPAKAKSKRKFVLGLREVTKHLKLGKLKCVIISPNLERIQSKGGLDEALNAIIEMSQKQDVPFVFALGRRALGRACAKLVPVSVVGVFSYDGCEENFFKLRDLTQKAREAYLEMVASLEQEMSTAEPPATNTINTIAGSFEKLFPHLGHSRTPSACSAISFISSILSEPISENYPQSEPETDSRGYEIRHDNRKSDLDTVGEGREETVEAEGEDKNAAARKEDFDDGHEADTEEDGNFQREAFNNKANSGTKEKSELQTSSSEVTAKLEPPVVALNSPDAAKPEKCVLEREPDSRDLSPKNPVKVQSPMSTSEQSDRIESWVAESQRVTKEWRELESTAAPVNADEDSEDERGEEDDDDGDDGEEMDDAVSLKTVEDTSNSEYEETTDVPFDHVP